MYSYKHNPPSYKNHEMKTIVTQNVKDKCGETYILSTNTHLTLAFTFLKLS